MSYSNPLGVQTGDKIAVYLSAYHPPREFITTVTGVQKRHSRDLIYALPCENEDREILTTEGYQCFDVSYVTHIVEKNKILNPVKNVLYCGPFIETFQNLSDFLRKGGYWMGSANELAYQILKNQPLVALEYGIDRKKLYHLWFKAGQPGFRHREYSCIHIKTFRKWLMRNVNRIALTRQAFLKEETDKEENEWREYIADRDMEWANEDYYGKTF